MIYVDNEVQLKNLLNTIVTNYETPTFFHDYSIVERRILFPSLLLQRQISLEDNQIQTQREREKIEYICRELGPIE